MVSYLDTTLVNDAEHTPKNRISQYLEMLFGPCFCSMVLPNEGSMSVWKAPNKGCENTKIASNTTFEAVGFKVSVKAYQ